MTPDSTVEEAGDGAPLAGYRVLDLCDERGSLCGRMFAELGADVIKVEPLGGCSSRRSGPFLDGVPGPDRSLYFATYQVGKRSVTLNLDVIDGQRLLGDLVACSDFLVESQGVGYFDERGIGYDWMSGINPRIIYTTVTPFGDRGPGAKWRSVDINCWAAGGAMFLTGLAGRPPLQLTVPQAGLHAGAEAATASLLAHFARLRDGQGQKVVVDTQACVVWTLMNEQALPLLHGEIMRRSESAGVSSVFERRSMWPCADGQVTYSFGGGSPVASRSSRRMVEWMVEEEAAPDWLCEVDFTEWLPARFMDVDSGPELIALVRRANDAVGDFIAVRTKKDLYHGALRRRIMLAPVATAKDIAEDEQLLARDFFGTVRHEGLGRDLPVLGRFAQFSAARTGQLGPAPALGEHNLDVYHRLLGVGLERLRLLYSTGVI